MNYTEFLERKKRSIILSGFDVDGSKIHPMLFPFQNFATIQAIKHGRYALLEECGLGKTFQQIEWANG